MLGSLGRIFLKVIGGSRNERLVRTRLTFVREQVNPLEEHIRGWSDDQLRSRGLELRRAVAGGTPSREVMPEAFAMVREASRRARDHRHFDVQLLAGMVLHEGCIAEEATGEGKTIACYPAVYMAVLEGMKVHVVTTNDYLVRRDAEFARPIFELLGVSVGYITSDMPGYGSGSKVRADAYSCDVTYGPHSEFGFDYLRDNTRLSVAEQVQDRLDFAIVDEVDSILIDEARTPLILSGPSASQPERFRKADAVARELLARNRGWDRANRQVEALQREVKAVGGELSHKGGDGSLPKRLAQLQSQLEDAQAHLAGEVKLYEIELDHKSAHMTHEGVAVAQEQAGVGSFYVGANMEWPHLMDQSLRAHLVYERDKDYVVQDQQVYIVDEFTGRVLEGRQWADGLHQAVEAKERVPIKDETQTNATITYQNYFRLYRKLAGMTGTAMTEAGEFMKIFGTDVVSVPTNRPVNRVDHNDRIHADVDVKYNALVEEIHEVSRRGRPVLVGTTSIEKSERISRMLTQRHGVEHQVLNARPENIARESEIVALAGRQRPLKPGSSEMVGTVTIATNMAGRGTDIKLGPGVVHDKCKVPPPQQLAQLGAQAEYLFPAGSTKCCIHCPQYNAATHCAHCFKTKLDGEFPLRGRTACRTEVPCGLHIVGTERHEARRIDNQLRGRSGRQGDPGSSRFFLSLRDDLMSIFAGEWTLKVLGWLGLAGDAAIEDKRVSKGIERAQKKVEERNFEIRKNLLEYDEVMDHQRKEFYGRRQMILEGRGLQTLVKEGVRVSLAKACSEYLDGKYAQRTIAEWARTNLQAPIRDDQIKAQTPEDLGGLEDALRAATKDEAFSVINMTLGEYMDDETPREEWDLRGLSSWAMSRFGVNLSQNQLRKMTPPDVETQLSEAAAERIDQVDLSVLGKYLEPDFPRAALAEWVLGRFGLRVSVNELSGEIEPVQAALWERIEQLYRRREIEYPVEYALEMTIAQAGAENVYALGSLAGWANRKFDARLGAEDLRGRSLDDIRAQLVELSAKWVDDAPLEDLIRRSLGERPDVEPAMEFARNRFDTELSAEDLKADPLAALRSAGRRFLRREMTELERFILLQIHDTGWMNHLLAMDHLRGGINLRSYAEQDPRVAYKREGSRLFGEMWDGIRDRVTDMILKVRISAGQEVSSVYRVTDAVHEQLQGYDHLTQDMAQAAQELPKVVTITRQAPRVGRNDPCPCGSGKKYKKCCGQQTA
jgi:preprotein translocase subunit SecA